MMFFKKLWCFAILLVLFSTTAAHAQIPLPARIGGTVTVDGTQLTQATATGYTFAVTKQAGTPYVPAAEDTDGLNASDWYVIDIPIYDAVHQPGGANPGDTAVIHVYKNGKEFTVTSPGNGQFTAGAEGSTTQIDLVAVTPVPAVTLNPTTLTFGNQAVGTTSAAQTVTLTNSGNATLNITSITGSGDFAVTNTCGATLAAGADCTISVTFSPTAEANRTGQITVTTDAASSPDTVALSGTGTTAPAVTLNPTTLTFGNQDASTTSAAQTVTLTNSGNATLNITSITGSGDFAVTDTCGATLAAGADCTISATFSPTAAGNRIGQITVTTDAASSPDAVALSGAGTGEVEAIPTMNKWGMIILSLLMAGSALWIMRKKGFERF